MMITSVLVYIKNRLTFVLAARSTRLAGVLITVLSLSANCFAGSTDSSPPLVAHSSVPAVQIRTLVASALADVAQIRAQIHDGKTDHLWHNLTQLHTLIALIKAARPTGEIDALMVFYQQHLAFEDNKQVLADIMPLYHALDALPPSEQSKMAHQQLNTVRSALQNGKRADALEALDNMQRTLSIDGVDFPLQAAEEKLYTIMNYYDDKQAMPKGPTLLGLETDLLQMLNAL